MSGFPCDPAFAGTWMCARKENFKEFLKPYDPEFFTSPLLEHLDNLLLSSTLTFSELNHSGFKLVDQYDGKETKIHVKFWQSFKYTDAHTGEKKMETGEYEEATRTLIRKAHGDKGVDTTFRYYFNANGELVQEMISHKFGVVCRLWHQKCACNPALVGRWKVVRKENFKEFMKPYDPSFSVCCCGEILLSELDKKLLSSTTTISEISPDGFKIVDRYLDKDTVINVKMWEVYSYSDPFQGKEVTETCQYDETNKIVTRKVKEEDGSHTTHRYWINTRNGELIQEMISKTGVKCTIWHQKCSTPQDNIKQFCPKAYPSVPEPYSQPLPSTFYEPQNQGQTYQIPNVPEPNPQPLPPTNYESQNQGQTNQIETFSESFPQSPPPTLYESERQGQADQVPTVPESNPQSPPTAFYESQSHTETNQITAVSESNPQSPPPTLYESQNQSQTKQITVVPETDAQSPPPTHYESQNQAQTNQIPPVSESNPQSSPPTHYESQNQVQTDQGWALTSTSPPPQQPQVTPDPVLF